VTVSAPVCKFGRVSSLQLYMFVGHRSGERNFGESGAATAAELSSLSVVCCYRVGQKTAHQTHGHNSVKS